MLELYGCSRILGRVVRSLYTRCQVAWECWTKCRLVSVGHAVRQLKLCNVLVCNMWREATEKVDREGQMEVNIAQLLLFVGVEGACGG